jgi:hypothetical protein
LPLFDDVVVVVHSSHDWVVLRTSFVEATVVVTIQGSIVVLVDVGTIGVHHDGMDQLLVVEVLAQAEDDELETSEVVGYVVVIVDAVVGVVTGDDVVVAVLNAELNVEASRRSSR